MSLLIIYQFSFLNDPDSYAKIKKQLLTTSVKTRVTGIKETNKRKNFLTDPDSWTVATRGNGGGAGRRGQTGDDW